MKTHQCHWCGGDYTPKIRINNSKYCCPKCSSASHNAQKRDRDILSSVYGSHAFDGVVASWWRSGSYPVGLMTGSECANHP